MSEEIKSDLLPISEAPRKTPKLIAALAKAQMEIYNPEKNRDVNFGQGKVGYKYAELCAVTEIIRQPTAKNGLTYTQTTEQRDGRWFVVTTLLHESGEEREYTYPLIYGDTGRMKKEQEFASGYTYAKRQALKGIFGIADDTEDKDAQDGNENVTITPIEKQSEKPKPKPKGDPLESIHASLKAAVDAKKKDDEPDLDEALKDPKPWRAELLRVAKEKDIVNDMPDIIRDVTGTKKKSDELSEQELVAVYNHVTENY
jgi:hypothetical protein